MTYLMRRKISELLAEVGTQLQEAGLAELDLYSNDHDIHAFYRSKKDPTKVAHVQGYPGMSTENYVRVWSRLMEYDKMMRIRGEGKVSIGNEHEAVVKDFPEFRLGVEIPYDSDVLRKKLARSCDLFG